MNKKESYNKTEVAEKKAASLKAGIQSKNFWTVFSIKAFGNDFDFYFSENIRDNMQSKGMFCKLSYDSDIILGDNHEER